MKLLYLEYYIDQNFINKNLKFYVLRTFIKNHVFKKIIKNINFVKISVFYIKSRILSNSKKSTVYFKAFLDFG